MKNPLENESGQQSQKSGQEVARNSASATTHGSTAKLKRRIQQNTRTYFGKGRAPQYLIRVQCRRRREWFELGADLVLQVTTRHLRRWEMAEAEANRPCSQPYTHADLWRLYQRRGRKGWDRAFAARVGLSDVFERFDQISFGGGTEGAKDDRSMMAAMMLRSIAAEGNESAVGTDSLPYMFVEGLVTAAKAQLRLIVDCAQARDILVKAFFEAALIAEAKRVPGSVQPVALAARSA